MSRRARRDTAALMALSLALAFCDIASKQLAQAFVRGRGAVPVVRDVLELRYGENRDIAFHLLTWLPPQVKQPVVFVAVATLLGTLMLVWNIRSRRARLVEHLAYCLVVAGGLGNLVDRGLRGYVIDFLQVSNWPVFNFADVWLALGGLVLVVLALSWANTAWRRGSSHPTRTGP